MTIQKRSVKIAGHPTSVSLEQEFWDELMRIASLKGLSLNALITKVDEEREQSNLSSALRLYVLRDLKSSTVKGL